jgi:heat shock protein HslJ
MTRLLASAVAVGVLLAGCAASGAPGTTLTGYAWQWTGSTTVSPASQSVVPDPQNDTIEFKTDQTFNGKADCNQISGTWSSTSGNGLTITVGPSTRAACGPNSLGDQFVTDLGKASAYVLSENKTLTLTLSQEGTMGFK